MSTKLNSYTLSDNIIDSMKHILNKSVQESTELGFTLCSDQKNNLHARNICTGETCTIDIEDKCDKEEKFAGAYHTHPSSHSFASASDLIHCGVVPNVCIGGETDNKIRCYTWKHNHTTKEEYNDMVDALKAGKRQINDHLHQKTFECMIEIGPVKHMENMIREEDKNVNMLFSLIRMAEQEKAEKHAIDKMKESMEPLLDRRRIAVNEVNKMSAELMPKYYEEKILE